LDGRYGRKDMRTGEGEEKRERGVFVDGCFVLGWDGMGWDVVMVMVMVMVIVVHVKNDVSLSAVLIMLHRHVARIHRGYAVEICFTPCYSTFVVC
jgi:hypothetical protein